MMKIILWALCAGISMTICDYYFSVIHFRWGKLLKGHLYIRAILYFSYIFGIPVVFIRCFPTLINLPVFNEKGITNSTWALSLMFVHVIALYWFLAIPVIKEKIKKKNKISENAQEISDVYQK